MTWSNKCVIFIFRRDLRWNDNVGLSHAFKYAREHNLPLVPLFIFNNIQIDPKLNHYYSHNSVQFMLECLHDLYPYVRYYTVEESDIEVLTEILHQVDAIFFNRDYTPFARKRDDLITELCASHDIKVYSFWSEYSLIDVTKMQKPFKVYGNFYNTYKNVDVRKPVNNEKQILEYLRLSANFILYHAKSSPLLEIDRGENKRAVIGGRKYAKERMHYLNTGGMVNYKLNRDFPYLTLEKEMPGTTMMSAYLKYGCISIREFYHMLLKQQQHDIIKELFWRAYYEQIVYHFPHCLSGQLTNNHFNHALNKDNTHWLESSVLSNKIMKGTTGIPIIDAAVRQLRTTGFMHNRLRMLVCMTACRIMKLDWRIFEKWFANHLIDYYPAVNRLSWEWSVTYRFVLNPWVQQEKFDKECKFIKFWVPELHNIANHDIHTWYESHVKYKIKYPKPIVSRSLKLITS